MKNNAEKTKFSFFFPKKRLEKYEVDFKKYGTWLKIWLSQTNIRGNGDSYVVHANRQPYKINRSKKVVALCLFPSEVTDNYLVTLFHARHKII